MIITKLIGGIGNQMYQYAFGKRTAYKNNTILKMDILGYQNQVGLTPREYALHCFNIQENFATTFDIFLLKKNNFFWKFFKNKTYFKESHFYFDNRMLKIPNNSYLDGYWASEKYFKDIQHIIRKEFTYKKPLDNKNAKMSKIIKKNNSISLHIRRGDYVSVAVTNNTHGVCDLAYYKKAISYLSKQISKPHFFLFSDDIEWVKQNLKLEYPTYYIDFNTGQKSYNDMHLMSLCKHNIIANSSFSWWGAWLNSNKYKIVIAPKIWFKDASINTNDLIPNSWLKL